MGWGPVMIATAVVLTGCGRLGFSDDRIDAAIDVAAEDAPGPDAAPPDALFHLAFEDDPGDGKLLDSSGRGRDAVCIQAGSCPTQVAGKRGSGAQFDGLTQYALIPHSAEIDATASTFTLAAWVYLDAQGDRVAVGKPTGSGSSDSWGLVAWSIANQMTCLETTTTGLLAEWGCSPLVLLTGTWYHLAGTWDGTTKAIYINGTRAASIAGTTIEMDASDIVIGGDFNMGQPAYLWGGRLDEVRLYDRVLADPEILLLAAP